MSINASIKNSMNTDFEGAARRVVRDLVVCMLAVNSWTVENVLSLVQSLEKEGLLDLALLRNSGVEDIAARLARAGYSRGQFLIDTMANNLKSLGTILTDEKLSHVVDCINSGQIDRVNIHVEGIRGVGAAVLAKFKDVCRNPPVPYQPIDLQKRKAELAASPEKVFVEDVMTAMLAVNQWTLERAYSILPGLYREGLVELTSIRSLTEEEIAARIERAGYKRGSFMVSNMTRNFKSLAERLTKERLEEICNHIRNGEFHKVEAGLQGVRGIGPSVLRKLRILCGFE